MATKALTKTRGWLKPDGKTRPVSLDTRVDLRLFNGDVLMGVKLGALTIDLDGTLIHRSRSAGWSVWVYDDGGPMAPKCKEYRVHEDDAEREQCNAAMFQSWLDVREMEAA
jgi:hypothetical protein